MFFSDNPFNYRKLIFYLSSYGNSLADAGNGIICNYANFLSILLVIVFLYIYIF